MPFGLSRLLAVAVLLACAAAVSHGQIYRVTPTEPGHFKIDNVVDINLNAALRTIPSHSPSTVQGLDLSGNVLTKVDSSDLAQFVSLRELQVSSNLLKESVDVSQLQTLQTLNANNNFIKYLMLGPSVKSLLAVNNQLTGVKCQRSFGSSKKFNLNSNKIEDLRDLSTDCRTGLEELLLPLNYIDKIDLAALRGSSHSLKILNLADNFIYDVTTSVQFQFAQLDLLDLSSNKITFLGEAFNVAGTARRINLRNNKIVLVQNPLKFTRVMQLELQNNEFQCETLKSFFKKHAKHRANPAEQCNGNAEGGYCCDKLEVAFADRLIELKRKEYSLYTMADPEQERRKCESEMAKRQAKLDVILDMHREEVDQSVSFRQMTEAKAELQRELEANEVVMAALERQLRDTAESLRIPFQNSLQALQDIVAHYDGVRQKEQQKQRGAANEQRAHEQEIERLLDEQRDVERANADLDESLQKLNNTLIDLQTTNDMIVAQKARTAA